MDIFDVSEIHTGHNKKCLELFLDTGNTLAEAPEDKESDCEAPGSASWTSALASLDKKLGRLLPAVSKSAAKEGRPMRYAREAERMIRHPRWRPGRMHLASMAVPAWYPRIARRIGSPALRRLMFRAGCARVRRTSYIMARAMLMEFLHTVVGTAAVLSDGAGRRTVMERDVRRALRRRFGMVIYN